MNRQIAISGASGLVGSKLASTLEQRGWSVRRLVRSRPRDDVRDIYWNPETGEIDTARLEGLDVVVHLAGKPLDEQRWTPEVKAAVYASRVAGTTFVSTTLARLADPPRLLVSASATDFYAETAAPVDEAEGRPGTGYLAEMCRDWEAATDAARQAGIRVVTIRIPSVLAREGHSILAAFLPLFRWGVGPILGTGRQLMCFISRDDLIRAVEHIIACDRLSGPVNVLAPEPVTNEEFARTLGRVLRRPVFVRLPGAILRLAMGEVADAILAGDACLRPGKLLATGFRFDHPDLESALRHELAQ
ncbi:MAG: TIGR01777 family oxidoreductase [Hyphomicrobiales bacterium]